MRRTWLARSPTTSPLTAHHTAASSTISASRACCCPGVAAPSAGAAAGATPRDASALIAAHATLRGRRERGRGWGGQAAAGAEKAEAEADLVVVRDAGGGHGVGEGIDSKAGGRALPRFIIMPSCSGFVGTSCLPAAKVGDGMGMDSSCS